MGAKNKTAAFGGVSKNARTQKVSAIPANMTPWQEAGFLVYNKSILVAQDFLIWLEKSSLKGYKNNVAFFTAQCFYMHFVRLCISEKRSFALSDAIVSEAHFFMKKQCIDNFGGECARWVEKMNELTLLEIDEHYHESSRKMTFDFFRFISDLLLDFLYDFEDLGAEPPSGAIELLEIVTLLSVWLESATASADVVIEYFNSKEANYRRHACKHVYDRECVQVFEEYYSAILMVEESELVVCQKRLGLTYENKDKAKRNSEKTRRKKVCNKAVKSSVKDTLVIVGLLILLAALILSAVFLVERSIQAAKNKDLREQNYASSVSQNVSKSQEEYNSTGESDILTSAVYTTDSGYKYHRQGCQYLSKSSKVIDLSKAIKQGYKPCSKCFPPAAETSSGKTFEERRKETLAKYGISTFEERRKEVLDRCAAVSR